MPHGLPPMPRRSRARRLLVPALLSGLLMAALAVLTPARVLAQDAEGGEAAAPAAADAAAPADDAAAPAGEAKPAEAAPADAPASESFLVWMARANGWLFGPIFLGMSFLMVALVMMCVLSVRRPVLIPTDFVEEFETKLNGKDYNGAYELARGEESFIGRVLAAGLGRLNRGYEEAIEGMQEVGEDENMAQEHRLSYLAMIGSLAPMVGLLGTVWGMIASFQIIANSDQSPKPKDLADGIATALFTTVEGLLIAIPALIAYGLLRNRLSRLVLEIGIISENLMSRFSTVGKKAAAGGAAPAGAPAAPNQ